MAASDVPVVSIVTATRNRPDLLRRALSSMAAQSFGNFESIVVDDGSEARFCAQYDAVLAEFDDRFQFSRVREPGARRSGPGAPRNIAIARARGRFLAFLDDDDYWTAPDHLAVGLEAIQRGAADLFLANMRGVRGEQVVIGDFYARAPKLATGARVMDSPTVHQVSTDAFVDVLSHLQPHHNTMIVSRELVTRVGGFSERIWFGEDFEFAVRVGDGARGILYRSDAVANLRLPEGDSVSLVGTPLQDSLDMVTASCSTLMACTRPEFQKCARGRLGWAFRELSTLAASQHKHALAKRMAWQALVNYPTAGAAWFFLRSLFHA